MLLFYKSTADTQHEYGEIKKNRQAQNNIITPYKYALFITVIHNVTSFHT